ncbi:MAG: toluene tolerance protein [Betaproteobacteria bacterium]|nr:toluene tolerance protein [Betaproteobacteria bacterium]
MQNLAHNDYLTLRADAIVLEQDRHGDKVLQLADGSFLKLFRRKRLISTAALYPYALRFADNARALAQRQIPCPQVAEVYRIPSIARDAVRYRPLPGQTLRQHIRAGTVPDGLHEHLGAFVAGLHKAGIYFRSLHLGNIVLTPDGNFGLIDIADLRASRRPLMAHRRQRNLQHLFRNEQDRDWIDANRARFDMAYKHALEQAR